MKKRVLILTAGCLIASGLCLLQNDVHETLAESENYLSWDFEDNPSFENCGSGRAQIVDKGTNPDGVFNGNKAMQVTSIWARKTYNNGNEMGKMLQGGYFYEFGAAVKKAVEGSFSFACQMSCWGENEESGWKACDTRIYVTPYYNLTDDEWHEIKYEFAAFGDGMDFYIYDNGGKLNKVSTMAGYKVADNLIIDVGATNGKSVYIDDMYFKRISKNRDCTIRVYDDNVEDVTLKVFNGDIELATQPEITRNGNLFTIKDLSFESLSQTYNLKLFKGDTEVGNELVSYIKNETNSYTEKYTVTLNLYDNQYTPIENSIVRLDAIIKPSVITRNDNGVVTISGLRRKQTALIVADGYIKKEVELSKDLTTMNVFLQEKNEVENLVDNITPEGSMEDGWSVQSSSNVSLSITNREQVTGDNSLLVKANSNQAYFNYRIKGALFTNKETFIVTFKAKSNGGDVRTILGINYIGNGNKTDQGGSVYPSNLTKTPEFIIGSEWKTYSYTVSCFFDESNSMIYTSINGGEYIPHEETCSNVAAADFYFELVEADSEVYIDNYSCFEMFDSTVAIKNDDGVYLENATFKIQRPFGEIEEIVAEYDSETKKYKIPNCYGETKIFATCNGKEYPVTTVTKLTNDISISEPYTITVKLETPKGKPITEANVVARIGITNKGTFTEIGDGIYKLENVMDTYTVVATKDGYTFERITNVNSKKCTFTMIGEPDEPEVDEETKPEEKNNTTLYIILGAAGGVVVVGAVIAFVIIKKRKHIK